MSSTKLLLLLKISPTSDLKISKASKPMVISQNNATKTTHLEQEKHILTLARWYREKYITMSDFLFPC
jgi:hypothetical protein